LTEAEAERERREKKGRQVDGKEDSKDIVKQ
jgi:hypothetical protein